jgi:hypothetical protein
MKSILEDILKAEALKNSIDYELISEIVELNIKFDSSDASEKRRRQKTIQEILESHVSDGVEV